MTNDPLAELKQERREGWAHFTRLEWDAPCTPTTKLR